MVRLHKTYLETHGDGPFVFPVDTKGPSPCVPMCSGDVNLGDIAALTAKSNVEYALFTRKGERMVIRGNLIRVNIYPEDAEEMARRGWRWSGHTHPGKGPNVRTASEGDYLVLKAFGQKYSVILDSSGRFDVFGGE